MQGNVLKRQSNMELLRIFAMLFIVFHHVGVHSGLSASADISILNKFWILFIQSGGKVGVNIFVLISGYFSITNTHWKIDKILKLWLQVFFYSVSIFAIFVALGYESFSITGLIKHLLPNTYISWWFVNTYFMLFLISPFLNKMLLALDKKTYQRALIFLAICWSVIPTFMLSYMQSNALLWFIFLYALAGYIRLYVKEIKLSSTVLLATATVIVFINNILIIASDWFEVPGIILNGLKNFISDMQQFPVFLVSILVFVGFLKIKTGFKPIINKIASATFGVYLIHDAASIRSLLWKTWLEPKDFESSNWLIPYTLGAGFAVFTVCAIIDLIRQYTLERAYMPIVSKLVGLIKKTHLKYFSKL